MKRIEPESIGDVLRQTLQEQGLTDRLNETKAIALWPAVVGPEIAAHCSRPEVRKGVMTVHVRTAPLKHELSMNRSALIRIINENIGKDVIKEIYFR